MEIGVRMISGWNKDDWRMELGWLESGWLEVGVRMAEIWSRDGCRFEKGWLWVVVRMVGG